MIGWKSPWSRPLSKGTPNTSSALTVHIEVRQAMLREGKRQKRVCESSGRGDDVLPPSSRLSPRKATARRNEFWRVEFRIMKSSWAFVAGSARRRSSLCVLPLRSGRVCPGVDGTYRHPSIPYPSRPIHVPNPPHHHRIFSQNLWPSNLPPPISTLAQTSSGRIESERGSHSPSLPFLSVEVHSYSRSRRHCGGRCADERSFSKFDGLSYVDGKD